jgi:hypothetical protein
MNTFSKAFIVAILVLFGSLNLQSQFSGFSTTHTTYDDGFETWDVFDVYANFSDDNYALLNVFNADVSTNDSEGFHHNDLNDGFGGSWMPSSSIDIPSIIDPNRDSYINVGYGVGVEAGDNQTQLDPGFGSGTGPYIPLDAGWFNGNPSNVMYASNGQVHVGRFVTETFRSVYFTFEASVGYYTGPGTDVLFSAGSTDANAGVVTGCTVTTACNYDSTATEDDGSCILPDPGYDCSGTCIAQDIDWAGDQDSDGFIGVDASTGLVYINVESFPNLGEATVTINGTSYSMDYADWGNNAHWYYAITPTPSETYNWTVDVTNLCATSQSVTGAFSTDCEGTVDGSAADGCTDSTACNYDSTATCDDGSCTVNDACGVCGGTGTVAGCTDSTACNYDSLADCDDGSCATLGSIENPLMISGVIDGPLAGGTPKAVELYVIEDIADLSIYGLGSANNGDGSDGQEFTFPSVSATAGSYITIASESTQFTAFIGSSPSYTSGSMGINGDDAVELFRDGSVIDVFGDINTDGNDEAWEYLDGWAYRNSGSYGNNGTWSVTDWSFSGANALDGETSNSTAATPFPIGSFTTAGAVATGCTDTTACNYDSTAICDDGSCAVDDACGVCGGGGTVAGCTDSTACNYDSTATCDDSSCLENDECGDCGGSGIAGCTDSAACNYDSTATCDDSSCLENDECGNCGGSDTAGCADSTACNYDSTAGCDDGSCEFISCNSGCTYASATNYDSTATTDDGSCVFEACDITSNDQDVYDQGYADGAASVPVDNCPEDLDNDGLVNVVDLLVFLSAYGNTCE